MEGPTPTREFVTQLRDRAATVEGAVRKLVARWFHDAYLVVLRRTTVTHMKHHRNIAGGTVLNSEDTY